MRLLLTKVLRLFPHPFRQQFGDDLIEDMLAEYQRAASGGRGPKLWFIGTCTLSLLRSALAEHWSPSWTGVKRTLTPRRIEATMLENWTRDLKNAARTIRRAPGFALVTIVTLGLALGANAGIFSVVKTVLLDPLPFQDTDRLVQIAASAPGSDFPDEFGVSAEFYVHYKEHSKLLEDVSTTNSYTNTLRLGDRAERVRMSSPTPSLFSTLGVVPLMGRLPVSEDENVVIISHALWSTWFGNDPEVLEKTVWVNGRDQSIIAVMKSNFWFPSDDTLLWLPDELRAEEIRVGRFGSRLVARVAPGVSNEALALELTTLAKQLPERFGTSENYARLMEQHQAVVHPLEEQLLGNIKGLLWALLGAVGIVLLIACANVANLLTVRAEQKRRDVAVQMAMGASRAQLIRAMLAEALVLSALAGGLAMAIAWTTVPLLVRAAPGGIPRLDDVGISIATLGFTFGVSVFTAILCGVIPAVRASKIELSRLREAGRGNTSRGHWGRNGLVVAQTALALVLLIGSGLLTRSFLQLRNVDPGYNVEDVFTFQIAPESAHLTDAATYARFHTDFMDSIRALAGVESVGLIENLPLNEGTRGARYRTEETGDDEGAGTQLQVTWAGPGYFETMEIRVLEGRTFQQSDHTSSLGNALISRTTANLMWPGESAIGRRFTPEGTEADAETWTTVVGVVDDVLQNDFRQTANPTIYHPLVQPEPSPYIASSPAYVVKTRRAETIGPEIRALVKEAAPGAPMYRMFTLEGLAANSMLQLKFTMLTLGIAAALAMILGIMGLYGVLSYVVANRKREIGVRMAVGAAPGRVQLMVVGQGAKVILAGVVLGVAAATVATRSLSSLLYQVENIDVATFAWTSAIMTAVGLLATYIPARRASKVDPIESLRSD